MDAAYGKRKKVLDLCPNPLFMQWLTEWRDDAASKGLKSQYNYSKALKSLKKYPLPFQSGRECKILENFGDKICKMLDDKLREYVDEYGTTEPVEGYLTIKVPRPAPKKPKVKKNAAAADGLVDVADLRVPAPPPQRLASGFISLDSGSEEETGGPNVGANGAKGARKRRQSSGPREYIPKYRSGAYAIMLTLLQKLEVPGSQGHMNKKDLMREAQPLADASFMVPDPGSRYTAWSSMGSLIRKGLIIKLGNPAKYKLTDAGETLARKLDAMDAPALPTESHIGFTIGLVNNNHIGLNGKAPAATQPQHRANLGWEEPTKKKTAYASTSRVVDAPLELDSSDEEMPRITAGIQKKLPVKPAPLSSVPRTSSYRAGAHALSDDSDDDDDLPSLASRMGGFSKAQDKHVAATVVKGSDSSPLAKPQTLLSEERLKFRYMTEDDREVLEKDKAAVSITDDGRVGFLITCRYEDLLLSGKDYRLDTSRASSGDDIYAYLSNQHAPDQATAVKPPVPKDPPIIRPTVTKPQLPPTKKNPPALVKSQPLSSTTSGVPSTSSGSCSLYDVLKRSQSVTTEGGDSQSSQGSIKSSSTVSSLPDPDFTLPPGMFEIILIVDKSEQFSRGAINKQTLLPELHKHGIAFEVRPLNVGDFLWVAREKGSVKEEGQELVFDYIVERKRMDDLAGSIVDGRFKEQKFRLRQCGLSHPIYLVEDYGSMQHFSIPEDSLKQAIINTQVTDNFYVKRTKDTKDSINYLGLMTRYIQSIYSGKTLVACSKKGLEDAGFSNDIHSNSQRLITFSEFNRASVKSKVLSIREMFGKQLVQLHGLTVEKALAVLEVYPTPNSLFTAYGCCVTDKQREGLLVEIKFGAAKRNIGIALSRQVSMLYNWTSALT